MFMMSGSNKKTDAVSPFALKIDNDFTSRADDVFGSLGNIEAKHEAYQKAKSKTNQGRDDASLFKDDPRDDHPMAGTSGDRYRKPWPTKPDVSQQNRDFKRPRDPPRRQESPPVRRGGGYSGRRGTSRKLDPDKWTYYNLSGVSSDDLSERSNTAAALSFLQSRKDNESPQKKLKTDRRDDDDDEMEVDGDGSQQMEHKKHVFKKSALKKDTDHDRDRSKKVDIQIAGRPGCVVMPEYSIGQKVTKKTSKKQQKRGQSKDNKSKTSNQVSISHLQDDDNDDNDNEDGDNLSSFRAQRDSNLSCVPRK